MAWVEKYGYENDYHFMIMGLLGPNLDTYFQQQKPNKEEIMPILADMALSVEKVHS